MTLRRHPLHRMAWLALVALVGAAPCAHALDASAFELAGSARAAEWSHSRRLDDVGPVSTAGVWARATAHAGADTAIVADVWAQGADHDETTAGLRELFVKATVGRFDLRAGRQVIAWGRADGVNPTDSIGRRDYRRLTVDDADQRDGADAVTAQWFPSDGLSLQVLWLPNFRSDVIPLHSTPMVSLSTDTPRGSTQQAVKLERTAGAVDWSVSWFDGVDRMPDLALASVGAEGAAVVLSNHRVRTLGADFSTSAGGITWRGELAWARRADAGPTGSFFRKRSQVMAVLGGDRAFGDTTNVNLQIFAQWVPGWRDPGELGEPIAIAVATQQSAINNQPGRRQFGATWRISTSWANEAWQAECSGIVSLTTHGTLVRAQLKHAFADRWRLAVGVDRYAGRTDTVFGQLRDNSTAYVELRALF